MSREADITRLEHMLEAAQEIVDFLKGRDLQSVMGDRPIQHLIVRNLEVLGEAASRITQAYRDAHPQLPWRDMIDLRNRLIHAYFDLDLEVIWRTVECDLPGLLASLKTILSRERPG